MKIANMENRTKILPALNSISYSWLNLSVKKEYWNGCLLEKSFQMFSKEKILSNLYKLQIINLKQY
jgi:hypothetical protein